LNFVLYETSADNDTANKRLCIRVSERIIVAGGDGTIKLVAEALESEDFVLGILPAVRPNGLARDLGSKTIEENLPIAFHNNYLEMDMIVVNGKKSLHLSDLGQTLPLLKTIMKVPCTDDGITLCRLSRH
jgi:diacylglycerol kinase family enzyme